MLRVRGIVRGGSKRSMFVASSVAVLLSRFHVGHEGGGGETSINEWKKRERLGGG